MRVAKSQRRIPVSSRVLGIPQKAHLRRVCRALQRLLALITTFGRRARQQQPSRAVVRLLLRQALEQRLRIALRRLSRFLAAAGHGLRLGAAPVARHCQRQRIRRLPGIGARGLQIELPRLRLIRFLPH